MPTMKTRINISLSDELRETLRYLAQRDQIPQTTQALRLIEKALEIEEDKIWDEIAEKRYAMKVKYISHKKAWKK